MKTRILLAALLGSLLALVPGPAHAKGVKDASLTGPGLDQPIEVGAGGHTGKPTAEPRANDLAEQAGLYDGLYGSTTGRLAPDPPPGDLGPRYVATYRLYAGEEVETVEARQELYPFAEGGAVTYTLPGQRPFGTEEPSPGGWFAAGAALTDLLVAAGVPVPAGAVVSPPRLAG